MVTKMLSVIGRGWVDNNNNDEYLEILTRTGPKRLHVLYKHIFVKIQCIHGCTHTHTYAHTQTRTRTHARARTYTHTHTHTHTHIPVAYQGNQGNETEEKFFKREMFSRKI